jgi:LPXTG-motif cell wall-anchored protein
VEILENFQYLNFLDNKIYTLANQDIVNFFHSNRYQKVCWYDDGHLYFTTIGKWQVDSLKLGSQDFTFTGQPVYTSNNSSNTLISGSVLALLAIAGFWFYKKRKQVFPKVDLMPTAPNTSTVRSPYPVKEVFEEIEKALLKLLMDNMTTRNSRTATDEVNRVLGMASKSGDMQKRKRSDVIRSINAKYRMLMPEKDVELIDRVKSDMDARLYEYCITASELPMLESHLS